MRLSRFVSGQPLAWNQSHEHPCEHGDAHAASFTLMQSIEGCPSKRYASLQIISDTYGVPDKADSI